MIRLFSLVIVILSLTFFTFSCTQQNTIEPEQRFSAESSDILLTDGEDPLGIESDEAFMVDAQGPMYFWVLDLTDAQKDSLKAIAGSFRDDFRTMHDEWRNNNASWEEIHARRDSIRHLMKEAFYQILTEEQRAILDEIRIQIDNGEYPAIVIEKKIAYLTEQLGLSADQQKAIADLLAEYGAKLIAARNDSENRRDFIQTRHAILQEINGAVLALLTDEQKELYQELRQAHKRNRLHHHFGRH